MNQDRIRWKAGF